MYWGVKIWSDGNAVLSPDNRGVKREGRKCEYNRDLNREKRKKSHRNNIVRKVFCAVRALKMISPAACFFTVTSAGRPGAIKPGEIETLFNYLRNVHGLREYMWVRERTKAGADHLHVVAIFERGKRMKYWLEGKAVELSHWWAGVMGQKSFGNSIRFGWYSGSTRKFYLSKEFGGGYCAKYLTKSEFKGGRKVGFSQRVAKYTVPVTFFDEIVEVGRERKKVFTVTGWQEKEFISYNNFFGGYPKEILKNWFWWKVENSEAGFFCYIGKLKTRLPLIEAAHILKYLAQKNL